MSFGEQKDVAKEKHTGITMGGREIVLSKTRGRPPKTGHHKQGFYAEKKKIEAMTVWAITGNMSEVQRLTGVDPHMFKKWRKEEWFKEALDELRNENDHKFDAAFTDIITKLIDAINDRVANGDHVVLRDGTLVRKPVSLRDVIGAMMITIDKRQILRNRPTSISQAVSMDTRLEKLVSHFDKLAKKQLNNAPTASPEALGMAPIPELVDEDQEDADPSQIESNGV